MIFIVTGHLIVFFASKIKSKFGPVGNMLLASFITFHVISFLPNLSNSFRYSGISFIVLFYQGTYIFVFSGLFKSVTVSIIRAFKTQKKYSLTDLEKFVGFDTVFLGRIKSLKKNGYFNEKGNGIQLSSKGIIVAQLYFILQRIFMSKHEL